jgi:hypothetical protein
MREHGADDGFAGLQLLFYPQTACAHVYTPSVAPCHRHEWISPASLQG